MPVVSDRPHTCLYCGNESPDLICLKCRFSWKHLRTQWSHYRNTRARVVSAWHIVLFVFSPSYACDALSAVGDRRAISIWSGDHFPVAHPCSLCGSAVLNDVFPSSPRVLWDAAPDLFTAYAGPFISEALRARRDVRNRIRDALAAGRVVLASCDGHTAEFLMDKGMIYICPLCRRLPIRRLFIAIEERVGLSGAAQVVLALLTSFHWTRVPPPHDDMDLARRYRAFVERYLVDALKGLDENGAGTSVNDDRTGSEVALE